VIVASIVTIVVTLVVIDTPPYHSRTEKATSPDARAEKKLSDAILEAAYDMHYAETAGHTNQWGESIKIDKKAVLDAMRKGIMPSY